MTLEAYTNQVMSREHRDYILVIKLQEEVSSCG